jgi:glycosyltransferase involved in cell wall biosynthesis/GT2 family glycosyltransferase
LLTPRPAVDGQPTNGVVLSEEVLPKSGGLSVVICTYERHEDLALCVAALRVGSNWSLIDELIIVDNAPGASIHPDILSHDDPKTRILKCQPGLSKARNVGLQHSECDFVAFIDDDAQVSEGWARRTVDALSTADVGAVGGAVLPLWPANPPAWLDSTMEAALSIRDDIEADLPLGEYLIGANMTFRRVALMETGGFPEGLGRMGYSLLGNEEHLPQDALRRCGYRVRLVAGAEVLHRIPAERMTSEWLVRRFAWQGVSDVLSGATHLPQQCDIASNGGDETRRSISSKQLQALRLYVSGLLSDGVESELKSIDAHQRPSPFPHARSGIDLAHSVVVPEAPVQLVLAEVLPGHAFLGPCLTEGLQVHRLGAEFDPWAGPAGHERLLGLLADSLFSAELCTSPMLWLTLDTLLQPELEDRAFELLASSEVEFWGLLHRVPITPQGRAALRRMSRVISGVLVFGSDMANYVSSGCGVSGVESIQLPATIPERLQLGRAEAKGLIGVDPASPVVGLVGDLSNDKGLDVLLDGLLSLGDRAEHLTLLLAGRGDDDLRGTLMDFMDNFAGTVRMDVRESGRQHQYDVLSQKEYANYLQATDVGALLYGPQLGHFYSGSLPNLVRAGSRIVGARNGLVGREVERYGLGLTVDATDPRAVGESILSLASHAGYPITSSACDGYVQGCRPSEVTAKIVDLLGIGR